MQEKQIRAALGALIGIRPKDELEGMMAAQLIAAHNAAMECFRRAMIGEQRLEGRRDNLAQANKLTRAFATLLEALNPASRQRPAEGHRGARSRPFRWPGGGGRRGASGGWGSREIGGATPCKANCLCTSVRDVVRGRRAGARANRRRCRTADAACMADHCQGRQRVTGTPSSTKLIPPPIATASRARH
jgi:hypothetical protein